MSVEYGTRSFPLQRVVIANSKIRHLAASSRKRIECVSRRKKERKNEKRMNDQQVTGLYFILLRDWLGGTMPNVRFKLKPDTMTEG